MELASFMANEASLKQVIKSQKKSLHSIKLNDLTYEIVPLANDESNMESNLDLLFKPVNGTNKGAQEYYTSIDLLKRLYPEQWESQKSNTALSEKTEIFGPNTQKRILRWAQFRKEFADKPLSKDIKKEFRWPAEQLSKLVSIYPGALQDLTRQVGPINWAVNNPGYINYNGLWLLINYGRVTNTNMFVKGSNPCVHQITNHLNYLEGRILQGNDDTIGLHFDAAINAAIVTGGSAISVMMLLASVLFVISDSVLGFTAFSNKRVIPTSVKAWVVPVTYYAAQLLYMMTMLVF